MLSGIVSLSGPHYASSSISLTFPPICASRSIQTQRRSTPATSSDASSTLLSSLWGYLIYKNLANGTAQIPSSSLSCTVQSAILMALLKCVLTSSLVPPLLIGPHHLNGGLFYFRLLQFCHSFSIGFLHMYSWKSLCPLHRLRVMMLTFRPLMVMGQIQMKPFGDISSKSYSTPNDSTYEIWKSCRYISPLFFFLFIGVLTICGPFVELRHRTSNSKSHEPGHDSSLVLEHE